MTSTSADALRTNAPQRVRSAISRVELALEGRAGVLVLVALVVAATAMWLVLGRQVTFRGDDMDHLMDRAGWSPGGFLRPHVGHLVAVQVLYERTMWSVVGLRVGWPYLMLNCLAWGAAVIGVALLVRRHCGPWAALGACALLLVLSTGAEDLLWPFQMGNLLSMTTGVWALLALDRRTRRADVLAALLLATSVAASSYGLVFLAAIALELALSRQWRREWIVVATLVPYAIWRIAYHPSTGFPLAGPVAAARFSFDYLSWTMTSFGVLPLAWGRVLAVAGVVAVLWRVATRRRLSPREASLIALPALLLVLTAVARGTLGQPQSGRYVLPMALLVVLLAGRLMSRWRPGPTGLALAAVILVGAAAANIRTAEDVTVQLRGTGKTERTALGALAIARPVVRPEFTLQPPSAYGAGFRADRWFAATDYYRSSPAYDLDQLLALPSPDRAFVDATIAAAERLGFTAASGSPGGAAPAVTNPGAQITTRGPCTVVRPGASHLSDVTLPAGGLLLRAGAGDTLTLRGRRLNGSIAPTVLSTTTDRDAEVLAPRDGLERPWRLQIEHGEQLSLCARAVAP